MDHLDTMLPVETVLELTTLSRSTLYREIEAGRFPRPTRIAAKRVAWPASAINQWIAGRRAAARCDSTP